MSVEEDEERMDWAYENEIFPYSTKFAPLDIICKDCGECGWGPMLIKSTWNSLVSKWEQFRIDWYRDHLFLCEDCMAKRLKRPLTSKDILDAPMNHFHPLYERQDVDPNL